MPKKSIEQIEEEKAQIKDILGHPALDLAFDYMRETYIRQLRTEQPGTLTAAATHAKLLAIEEIPGALQALLNENPSRRS